MKRLFLLLFLLAVPIMGATYKIEEDMISYLGRMKTEEDESSAFGLRDMTYVPDCFNSTAVDDVTWDDPTPSDGWPGCLLTIDEDMGFVLFDIVPPTGTGTNLVQIVGDEFDMDGTLPENADSGCPDNDPYPCDPAVPYAPTGTTNSEEISVYYDDDYDGIGGCRVFWVHMREYAAAPQDNAEVFGYSDCDPDNPNPQGMWRWTAQADVDTTTADPYRATMYTYGLRRFTDTIADDYFGGNEMYFATGKSTGSRGSSLGPSLGVRPWTFPTDSGGWDDLIPVMYYKSGTGYPRWYTQTKFSGVGGTTQLTIMSRLPGGEAVRIINGADEYEAMLYVQQKPKVDSSVYPANDPANSSPDESEAYDPVPDGRPGPWQTYAEGAAAGDWPDPTVNPIVWYGIERFSDNNGEKQQPSYMDFASDGSRIPWDTNIISTCSRGTGPGAQVQGTVLWLYELAELGKVYAGTSAYQYDTIQPYGEVDISTDIGNDGRDPWDGCMQPGVWSGVIYYPPQNAIIFSHADEYSGSQPPYSSGSSIGLSVWQIDVGAEASDPDLFIKVDGEISGGTIQ